MSYNKIKVFDAHLHIIDPRFPLVANQGYLPDEYTHEHYLAEMLNYELAGGVVVSGSFQAQDQSYLQEALKQLGNHFVGVTQLPPTVSDEELIRLNHLGVRAIRFNFKRGGGGAVSYLDKFARRVYETVGWHAEVYADGEMLAELCPILESLPALSIDHLGLNRRAFRTLLHLAEKGVKVKASGFSRVDFDIPSALKALYAANPDALMFGSDLPSTRAPLRFRHEDIQLICDTLEPDQAKRVLSGNAIRFYRLRSGV
ncbi:amidohydrolase family protein [Nitrincola alkalilacustris]|uniref:amidohydrolase family protein n=1 Tax=Nitrincola alkalilacustris TaxID=1571224 RepID=UPI00124E689E|nr:amidohydrolase family protein [Nitrincola alkalilacustris]